MIFHEKFDRYKKKKLPAFTLTELLVVLVIVGILVLLALPNLMPLISKAKSTEAQISLKHIYTLQKSYYYLHSKYSNNLEEIGFEKEKLITEGGQSNYQYQIVQSSLTSFKATATAVADFDNDGDFNKWVIDQDQKLIETIKD